MSPRTTTDWDARTYDRLAAPQEEWARAVLERLPLSGGETVLDAGCGSGRVTKLLAERLSGGRVIGIDGSPSMIEFAGENLAAYGDRVRLVNSDLLELSPELLREEAGADSVDVVFSNATFHWIADHDRLFRRLFADSATGRPAGRAVRRHRKRGGMGAAPSGAPPRANRMSSISASFHPWNFVSPKETEERLSAAGFEEIRCWLEEITPYVPEDPRDFVSVVGLVAHHERLPAEEREGFTDAVIEELPEALELRYVRLNLEACRPQ